MMIDFTSAGTIFNHVLKRMHAGMGSFGKTFQRKIYILSKIQISDQDFDNKIVFTGIK